MPRNTLVSIGVVARPHGVGGELKLEIVPAYLEALLHGVQRVFLGPARQPYRIRAARQHQRALLVQLEGVHTRNDAEALRGAEVLVHADELPPLPKGEYYVHELLGLRVFDVEAHAELGELTEVLATGSNDVYVVRRLDGRELLLPALPQVILSVDLEASVMHVRVPEGLE
ncbi:MAG: ribosome maturation factor RimM [Thermoflexales bacterium]|nr:ribosome maturation factor RimM [Thermoflexales bacterium]MDW8292664.1 ribosome maturation factor RimM [Anaerolineae bacterium]